jgi:hypothetical protein
MSGREERLARNEAISREINEGIEEAERSSPDEAYTRMLCECGHRDCDRVVAITLDEYAEVRQDPRRFFVVAEHVIPDIEVVRSETERFTVVRKLEGTPAEVAESTDPRD